MNGAAPVRRTVWLAAIALLLALAAAAIWRFNARPAAPPGPVEVLRLAVNAEYVGSCPVLAARAHGYFAREGIDALLQPYSSGKASLEAVLQGEADLVTPPEVSRAYFDALTAPKKEFVTMPRTGHDPNVRMIDMQFEVLKTARAAAMAGDRR